MNTLAVSIILPVYNVEKYINKCLDTLINQTLKEIEIILIDDCGQDNSIKIAETYAQKDNRIVIIYNKKNIGSGFSRNAGIKIARGEYLAFADPDDWVDLDFYDKLYKRAKKGNYDIVKSRRIKVYCDENNRIEKQETLNIRIKKNVNKNTPLFLHFTYEHTTAIFKTNLIHKHNIKFPNLRNSQDTVFLLYVTFYTEKIFIINDNTYYYYRIIKSSVTHQIDKEFFTSQLKIVEMEIDFLNNKNITKEHYLLFIKQSLYILHSKIEQIPNEGEFAKFKNEFVYKIINIFNNIKYINEDKIIDIIDVIIGEKSNIFKKIMKVLINRKTRRRIRIFLNKE